MPDRTEQDDQPAEEQERERERSDRENEDQADKVDHHIPAPPKKKKHRKKHWEHLPGVKRKPIRSFKSPGRK